MASERVTIAMTGRPDLPDDLWDAVLDWLAVQRAKYGELRRDALEQVGAYIGRSPDQVRRRFNQRDGPSPSRPPKLVLTQAQKEVLAGHKYITQGHRDLKAVYPDIGSYSRTYRAVNRLAPGEFAAIKRRGPIDVPDLSMHVRYRVECRNDSNVIDHKLLDQEVRDAACRHRFRPWLTSVFDEACRVPKAWLLSPKRPNAITTVAVVAASIRGYEASDGTFIGGRPERLHHDNGKDLTSNYKADFEDAIGLLGFANTEFSPELDGIIESFHGTVDDEFSYEFPGATNGPRERWHGRTTKNYFNPADIEDLPEFGVLIDFFGQFMIDYTETRVNSTLGSPPLVQWKTDSTPLVELPDELLAFAMLKRKGTRLVDDRGVSDGNKRYVSAKTNALEGRKVEIRVPPRSDQRPDYIAVFYENSFHSWAKREDLLSEREVGELEDARIAEERKARALSKAAARRRQVRYEQAIENGDRRLGPLSGVQMPDPLPRIKDHGLDLFEMDDSSEVSPPSGGET